MDLLWQEVSEPRLSSQNTNRVSIETSPFLLGNGATAPLSTSGIIYMQIKG